MSIYRSIVVLVVSSLAQLLVAEDFNDHTDFERHSVYYSIFNSTFIPADVAATYGIKRSAYESLINVSISPKGKYGAYPAKVSGTVTNLMQQQKLLDFIEIKEKGATYYIAPIRINGEEVVHFNLLVIPDENEKGDKKTKPLKIKFSKKIYADK